MRNLKKFLALVLAMLMVVSAGATVSAYSDVAEDDAYAAAIAALTEWGIVNGTELGEAEDGSDALYEPDADVTRWQMALMMARTLAPEVEDEEWAEGMEIFGDVTEWYGAIAYAYVEGIVNGVSTEELVFKPNDGIKYQDGLIMALRALGYEVDCSGVVYWLDAWTQAKAIGLTDGIAITSGAKTMTRAEMAQLIYNMINLPFADGSYSLAIKYYGAEAPAEPEVEPVYTTFVITATPNQAYVVGQHTNETLPEGETAAALLGIQKKEAGIPSGDILYIEAAELGIADADADKYLHYAVNLKNFDAETNYYEDAAIVDAPVVVRSNALSANGKTIKVGGYTYYPVASLTDAALRNEIVVFSGNADIRNSKILIKNKDGDILNFDGSVRALYAYTLGTTNYYIHQNIEVGNTEVISETVALDLYGVIAIDNAVFTEYETMTAAQLNVEADKGTAYQLSLFDDDTDGKYDRAIYDKVYMTVYNDGNDGKNTAGIAYDKHANLKWSDASVKSKGTVFTYTYNKQLKQVNVIEKLASKTGVVTKVDIKNNTVTIDGTTYTLAASALDYKMGADLQITAGKGYADIAKGGIDYPALKTFYSIGSSYNFYAYNGYILAGQKINPVDEDANAKLFVSAGAYAYDSTAIYVDGYVANGEKTTIEISVIDADFDANDNLSKDTALADMNIFDLGEFLATVKALFAQGNIFRIVPREDGTYRLLTNKATADATLTNVATYDFQESTDSLVFSGGISNMVSNKNNRLRTDAETVFYFVKYNATGIVDLDVVVGQPDDGDKITVTANNSNGTYVYADLIGWGRTADADESANSGVANTVLVYYSDIDTIGGFNLTVGIQDYAIVYVTAVDGDKTGVTLVPGSEVNDSATPYFWKMADKNALNMATGEVISTVYYAGETYVTAAGFYKMDKNNVITALTAAEKAAVLTTATQVAAPDFDDQYVTLASKAGATLIARTNKVSTVYHTNTTAGDIALITGKNSDNAKNIVANEYVVMLTSEVNNNNNDGKVVIVEVAAPTVYCNCCDDCDCVGTTCAAGCDCACCEVKPVANGILAWSAVDSWYADAEGQFGAYVNGLEKGKFNGITVDVAEIADLGVYFGTGVERVVIVDNDLTTVFDTDDSDYAAYTADLAIASGDLKLDIYKTQLTGKAYLDLAAGTYQATIWLNEIANSGAAVNNWVEIIFTVAE